MEWFVDIFKSILGWVFGLLCLAVFLGVCWLLGQSGRQMRRGIQLRKQLKAVRIEALAQGHSVNARWHEQVTRSRKLILLPAAGWILAAAAAWVWLPGWSATVILVPFVPAVMGFFGYFFAPSDEVDDYL